VAGIAGLKSPEIAPKNPSANLLRNWIEEDTFVQISLPIRETILSAAALKLAWQISS
jgi:hypothetical protein